MNEIQSKTSDGAGGAGPRRSEPGAVSRFRGWFWRPPRAHGEVEPERRVSFLELFYDLVYVVVIAQAARQLAGSTSVRGYLEFLVVFSVVWVAWANGTLYYELHGREDGRTRTFVFIQMALLALLAVFTAGAAGDAGSAFAVVYIAFLAVMTWLWYTVRRQDRPEYMAGTALYLAAMAVSIAVFALSALLPADARLVVWALFSIGWLAFILVAGWASRRAVVTGIVTTDSMVERFDLLVIIVLGEVVTGVVNGLSAADKDAATLGTGFVALLVGFGLWWIFFDVGGRRLPRLDGVAVNAWIEAHLPIAVAIVGAGAAMVGLIEHAHDPQAPAATSWLLGGSVARRLRSPRGHLSATRGRHGRGAPRGLVAAGPLAPRARPRRHPRRGLALRGRPTPQDRDLGPVGDGRTGGGGGGGRAAWRLTDRSVQGSAWGGSLWAPRRAALPEGPGLPHRLPPRQVPGERPRMAGGEHGAEKPTRSPAR